MSEAENELLRAHRKLDSARVPRDDDHGQPLSLALRIAVLIETLQPAER